MVFCRGNMIYMARRIEVSLAQLRDAASQEQAVQALALEMQRSLDYFESQLRQVPSWTYSGLPAIQSICLWRACLRPMLLPRLLTLTGGLSLGMKLLSRIRGPVWLWAPCWQPIRGCPVRQEVNLYTEAFRPSQEWLTLSFAARVSAAALLVVAIVGGWTQYQVLQLHNEQQQTRAGTGERGRCC